MDYRDRDFSPAVGIRRRSKAEAVMGKVVVAKIIALALYWLGAKRPSIAAELKMPVNSLRTMLRTVLTDGLAALQDRRRKYAGQILPPAPSSPAIMRVAVTAGDEGYQLCFGEADCPQLVVPNSNKIQARVLLLSLLQGGLINASQVANVLDLSVAHVQVLAKRLFDEDVHALIDKRTGQQKETVLTDEVKSEMILQWAANAVSGRSVSGKALAADLAQRCEIVVPERTLRYGLAGLKLQGLATRLRDVVSAAKKNSRS